VKNVPLSGEISVPMKRMHHTTLFRLTFCYAG